MKSSMKTTKR